MRIETFYRSSGTSLYDPLFHRSRSESIVGIAPDLILNLPCGMDLIQIPVIERQCHR